MGATYRLLLDENIEHEVLDRLSDAGHDIEHVDFVSTLGKGTSDTAVATYSQETQRTIVTYSQETQRTIVTYDDDFIEDVPPSEYRAALFFEDETLAARELATIIDAMAQVYPYEELVGLQKTGRQWL